MKNQTKYWSIFRGKALSKACNLSRKLKKDFVAIRFGNDYVVSTPLKK